MVPRRRYLAQIKLLLLAFRILLLVVEIVYYSSYSSVLSVFARGGNGHLFLSVSGIAISSLLLSSLAGVTFTYNSSDPY